MTTSFLFPEIPAEASKSIKVQSIWSAPVLATIVLALNEIHMRAHFSFDHAFGYAAHLIIQFASLLFLYLFLGRKVFHYLLVSKRGVWGVSCLALLLGVLLPLVLMIPEWVLSTLHLNPLEKLLHQTWFESGRLAWIDRHSWITFLLAQIGFVTVNWQARRRLEIWRIDDPA